MSIRLSDEFSLLAATAVGDLVADVFEEVIDLLIYLPEAIHTIVDGFSSSWPVPGVFDDSISIPHDLTQYSNGEWTTSPSLWFHDVDVSAYAPPNVPSALLVDTSVDPPTAVTSVPGDAVGRTAFLAVLGIVTVAIVSFLGVKKASSLLGILYGKLFGIKASINKLDDKVDSVLALLEQPAYPDSANESGKTDESVMEQFDVLKSILMNADHELTGLIKGILQNRRGPIQDIEWTTDVPDSRKS